MTIVIARTFRGRILTASDTFLSSPDLLKCRDDIFPGQIKSLVLSHSITVSFAGNVNNALSVIRNAVDQVRRDEGVGLPQYLVGKSLDCGVDFIICQHHEGVPRICMVKSGVLTRGIADASIGDASSIAKIEAHLAEAGCGANWILDRGEYGSAEELRFSYGFDKLFQDRGVVVEGGIGGFPVQQLASPYGHTYVDRSWSQRFGRIPSGYSQEEDAAAHQSGEKGYDINIMSGPRGTAIIGVYLPQPRIGYVYEPLVYDEPHKRIGINLSELNQEIQSRGKALREKLS